MALKTPQVVTGLATPVYLPGDSPRQSPAIAIHGGLTSAKIVLNRDHTIFFEDGSSTVLPQGMVAVDAAGSTNFPLVTKNIITYVKPNGTQLLAINEQDIQALALEQDIYPLHFVADSRLRRYQPRFNIIVPPGGGGGGGGGGDGLICSPDVTWVPVRINPTSAAPLWDVVFDSNSVMIGIQSKGFGATALDGSTVIVHSGQFVPRTAIDFDGHLAIGTDIHGIISYQGGTTAPTGTSNIANVRFLGREGGAGTWNGPFNNMGPIGEPGYYAGYPAYAENNNSPEQIMTFGPSLHFNHIDGYPFTIGPTDAGETDYAIFFDPLTVYDITNFGSQATSPMWNDPWVHLDIIAGYSTAAQNISYYGKPLTLGGGGYWCYVLGFNGIRPFNASVFGHGDHFSPWYDIKDDPSADVITFSAQTGVTQTTIIGGAGYWGPPTVNPMYFSFITGPNVQIDPHNIVGTDLIYLYTPQGDSTGWAIQGNGLDDTSTAIHIGKHMLSVSGEIWTVNADCTISRFTPDRGVAGPVITPPSDSSYQAAAALVLSSVSQVWVLNHSGNSGAGSIHRYNFDGTSAGSIITGGGIPTGPSDMQMAGDNVWVGNSTTGTIARFTASGSSIGTISAATGRRRELGAQIGSIFWVLNGVTGSGDSSISRFHLDGTSAGSLITGNGLNLPQQIVNFNGSVYVACVGGVSIFTPIGTPVAGSPWTDPTGSVGPDFSALAVIGSYLWVRDTAGSIAILASDLSRIGTIPFEPTLDYIDPISDWWSLLAITGAGLSLRITNTTLVGGTTTDAVTLNGLIASVGSLQTTTNVDLNTTPYGVVFYDESNTVVGSVNGGRTQSVNLWRPLGSTETHHYTAVLSTTADLSGAISGTVTNSVTVEWPTINECNGYGLYWDANIFDPPHIVPEYSHGLMTHARWQKRPGESGETYPAFAYMPDNSVVPLPEQSIAIPGPNAGSYDIFANYDGTITASTGVLRIGSITANNRPYDHFKSVSFSGLSDLSVEEYPALNPVGLVPNHGDVTLDTINPSLTNPSEFTGSSGYTSGGGLLYTGAWLYGEFAIITDGTPWGNDWVFFATPLVTGLPLSSTYSNPLSAIRIQLGGLLDYPSGPPPHFYQPGFVQATSYARTGYAGLWELTGTTSNEGDSFVPAGWTGAGGGGMGTPPDGALGGVFEPAFTAWPPSFTPGAPELTFTLANFRLKQGGSQGEIAWTGSLSPDLTLDQAPYYTPVDQKITRFTAQLGPELYVYFSVEITGIPPQAVNSIDTAFPRIVVEDSPDVFIEIRVTNNLYNGELDLATLVGKRVRVQWDDTHATDWLSIPWTLT